MLKLLAPCVRGYRIRSVLASVTVIFEVLLEVYIPYLMADIINTGIENKDVEFILRRGGLMVGMALLALLMGVLCVRFAVTASSGFAHNLRARLFEKVTAFSFGNTDRYSTATLVTRLTTDVTNVQQSFQMIIRMLVRAPIMLISATIMAVRINTQLSTVFAVAIPVLAVAVGLIAITAFPRFKVMLGKFDSMNAEVQENLIAIRVVKAFVRGKYEAKNFESSAEQVRQAQVRAEKAIILGMPIAQLVMSVSMIAVCYLGGRLIVGGAMETGDLMSFISYITQIIISLMMIMMVLVMLVLSRASVSRICEVLQEKIDITDDGANPELVVEEGSIRFEKVDFSYSQNPDNLTLEDVELEILPGESVGIIGGTGSGKSTLVQLIPRLYDVLDGRVLVSGHDVREYTLENLRSGVAMVLQNNVLFSGTIRENLRWGDEAATDAELEAACRVACAHDFIMGFEKGYDTVLGQGGVNLSGGQKQRLCIARALVKKPRIIIMDDSTSAVDTATDESIRTALRTQLKGTTTITIAQRVASVAEADKIIVMNEGAIDAVGTHQQLLENNEIYREVYQSQMKGVEG